ncbi:1-aminocyclopropane-1-carboxylate oxidase [Hondaea fermentalgiana]|uniref:1-aminocyclopropane-1-carboxylate oxidase n=1 Tax=Hondaea fermentalgiana TaxID=2315210 RepID=A0A2R5G8C2_9STRA|nr:1-aminocyclopropane-1-carboxylate oxidase [Hondaea fermentalgiana]|eukprot:GBG26569.1 1-aminocyclopropane-1-carboxylate oxidase [Hondaea fermentalgiana]
MLQGAATGFRGFQVCGQNVTQGKADQHEGLDLMREIPMAGKGSRVDDDPAHFMHKANLWPTEEEAPGLRTAFTAYADAMTDLGFRIMAKVDDGLRETCTQEEAHGIMNLPEMYDDPFWIMRAIRYPPASSPTGVEEQGVGEHRDYGLLTMILQDDTPGCLQIRRENGAWEHVDPVPDCLVVNIGDVLDFWTGGYFKATPHRVLAPRDRDRVSLPFFFEPNLHAPILPDGTTYEDHVLSKLSSNFADPTDQAQK